MSWALVLAAYLLGSVPFSYLVVRWRSEEDIRARGSGNVGATNALRVAGPAAGALALALDLSKGALPVLAARGLGQAEWVAAAAAAAAVAGHVLPVFLGFRGGKGVATAIGAGAILAPMAAAMAILVFALVVAATRYVSLASLIASFSFPLLLLACGRAGWCPAAGRELLLATVLMAFMIVVRHIDNVRRLRGGTEPRLGERRPGGGG